MTSVAAVAEVGMRNYPFSALFTLAAVGCAAYSTAYLAAEQIHLLGMSLSAYLTLSQAFLNKVEHLLVHQRREHICTDYPLAFVLESAAAVSDILRHTLVVYADSDILLIFEDLMQSRAAEFSACFGAVSLRVEFVHYLGIMSAARRHLEYHPHRTCLFGINLHTLCDRIHTISQRSKSACVLAVIGISDCHRIYLTSP